jgi:DNA polymerase elongation subunit (family B)
MEGALAISRGLKKPHNLEFEKGIWPFMLLSKKRYHGHYYTSYGSSEYTAKSMGIVLKRRDNAQIVKHIFGGTIDIIFEEHNLQKAIEYCKTETKKLLEGKFPMDKFVLTKTLKSYYKLPEQVSHWVLAQRMAERDPGNKPQSNDRMEFAYITIPPEAKLSGQKVLQGERIETPEYIKVTNKKLDYRFYLTNQVMKPVLQIFELKKDEVKLEDLFMESLMEYDRKMTGTKNIAQWVSKGSKEYKARYDEMFKELLAEIDDERDDDVLIEAGDELYGN